MLCSLSEDVLHLCFGIAQFPAFSLVKRKQTNKHNFHVFSVAEEEEVTCLKAETVL